jgi:general stress protein 26
MSVYQSTNAMPTYNPGAQQLDPVLTALLERFAQAEACWFSSARLDGRPHLAPIWHIMHLGTIFVVTQRKSVRSANIRLNPAVSLALADTSNALIIEGMARPAGNHRSEIQPHFLAKYDWDISTDGAYDDVIAVTPRKVIAWGSHGEGRWLLEAP